MKKVLLLCLSALMCCATGAWALSGSGTEDDPYVIQDGDQFTLTAQTTVYASFTAPSNGTLNLAQSGWSTLGWQVKTNGAADYTTYPGYQENYGDVKSTDFPAIAKGQTILIKNNGTAWSDETITVSFASDDDDPNAFAITSVTPEEGSALGSYKGGETVLEYTTDKAISYMRVRIDGRDNGYMAEVAATPVGEGTPVLDDEGNPVIFVDQIDPSNTYELKSYTQWKVVVDDIGGGRDFAWDFFEGDSYTFKISSYKDPNGKYEMTPLFTTSLTYTGSTPAIKYSDIVLESVSPSPDVTDVSEMPSSNNPYVKFTFSGLVDVKDVGQAIGMGAGVASIKYNTEDVDGKTVVTAKLEGSGNEAYLEVVVKAVDRETGLDLNDENGPFADNFNAGQSSYTVSMPWADGRSIDYLLTCESVEPQDGAYVESLDNLTLTLAGAADTDNSYSVGPFAKAGVYNEAGEQLYDVLLVKSAEGKGNVVKGTVCELGTADVMTEECVPVSITTPGKYVVKIDSMSIGDGNFDYYNPWQSDMGGYTKGRCNPTWTFTYNVVDEIVKVVDVDPAVYTEGGEWTAEMPKQVRITLSSKNINKESIKANDRTLRQPMDFSVESDSIIVLNLSEEEQAQSRLIFTVYVEANNGAPVLYNNEEGTSNIMLVYQTTREKFVPSTVTPADGSTVESLSEITLGMDEPVSEMLNADKPITLEGDNGLTVGGMVDFGSDANSIVVYLDDEVKTPGTYTLTIPAETFYNSTYDLGYTTPDYYNPELKYVFIISDATGISAIKAEANGNVKVYTIGGVYVGEGEAKQMVDSLPAGVYIINGVKVAIK